MSVINNNHTIVNCYLNKDFNKIESLLSVYYGTKVSKLSYYIDDKDNNAFYIDYWVNGATLVWRVENFNTIKRELIIMEILNDDVKNNVGYVLDNIETFDLYVR